MAAGPDAAADLGALFESIAGRPVIVERQRDGVDRVDEGGDERAVASYLRRVTSERGFADVIDDPEEY